MRHAKPALAMIESGLLSLPPEIMHRIWLELQAGFKPGMWWKDQARSDISTQRALRCTCKRLRDVVTPWIRALDVHGIEAATLDAVVAAFPQQSTLKTLRWDTANRHPIALVPDVVPGFFACSDSSLRLASLTCVELFGTLFLGYGDLASITTACPRLSKLSLTDTSLFKSALAPLAQLSGLKTLHLRNISLFARHAWFTSALACLTRLTDLCISTRERDDAPPAPSLGVPLLEDALIVPLLMQSLCVLELGLDAEFSDSGGTLLANIADLQSLQSVTVRAELRLSVPDFAEPLTLAPSLTTFEAPAATADAGAIKALASVPYVSLWELDPEVDVSNVPCKWVVLSLGRCTSPRQLLYSPKGEAMTLNFVEPDALTWVLKAGDGVDVVCSQVQRVSEVLARYGKPYGDRFEVSLGWDNGDVSPSAGARLIAALAPLGGKCLNLSLDHDVAEQWQLNGEQARQLRQHLPNVKQLTLNPTAPGFDQFAAALADAIPELSTLRFGHWVDELTPQARDALLAMAVARARAGLMMKIYTGQLLTLEQRLSMNELIRGHADAVGEGVMVWFVGEDGV